MEYVPGKTLDRLIPRGGMPLAACFRYALQVVRALAAVHKGGLTHRDLKPGNFIVTENGVAKMLDFGLVKVVDRPRARRWSRICRLPETRDGTILGTIGYMAPEQVRGQPADQRSDIFSFGAVFYEMLTGRRAFRKADDFATMHAILYEPPPKLPARIPIRIARIVQRCLAMDPNQRYRTGGELAAALGRVAAIIQ